MMQSKFDILCHSLGRDEYGISKGYRSNGEDFRNHFCTGPGSDDFAACKELVVEGLMDEREPTAISGGSWIFHVTDKGIKFIADNAPKKPKLSRSKARYKRYLEYGEGFESFRDFLSWDGEPERSWNQL